MNRFLSIFILASCTLILSVSIGLYLNNRLTQTQKTQKDLVVYSDSGGNPLYAIGECDDSTDCTTGGCSSEFCTNDKDTISDCALKEDFPNKENYQCGCVNNSCVWYSN